MVFPAICVNYIMIESAKEFIKLRHSECQEEYQRAGFEEATHETWLELIENYPDMKIWVARNRTISVDIMRILSDDKDAIVRSAIASKHTLPQDLFIKLAQDKEETVRNTIVFNKKTPLNILQKISKEDPSEFIRNQALEKIRTV